MRQTDIHSIVMKDPLLSEPEPQELLAHAIQADEESMKMNENEHDDMKSLTLLSTIFADSDESARSP